MAEVRPYHRLSNQTAERLSPQSVRSSAVLGARITRCSVLCGGPDRHSEWMNAAERIAVSDLRSAKRELAELTDKLEGEFADAVESWTTDALKPGRTREAEGGRQPDPLRPTDVVRRVPMRNAEGATASRLIPRDPSLPLTRVGAVPARSTSATSKAKPVASSSADPA
jgi:hypothetical protein